MVRPNADPPQGSTKGFDQEKDVNLNAELEKAGKATFETQFPDGEPNKEPIDVRGDIEPEKKG